MKLIKILQIMKQLKIFQIIKRQKFQQIMKQQNKLRMTLINIVLISLNTYLMKLI